MLVIRLQRVGRKNDPAYRMVVGERRSKPQSNGMEVLGSYHPKTKETILKNDRILHWMSKGAQVSDTAYNMLVSKGVVSGKKRSVVAVGKLKARTVPAPAAPVEEAAS
ncbi:MAG: 30S ribosomal protein S16 [Candidatus Sungbacteria bacterium]|nr:30S ribosomal protein S16 [Candidatus Sungbacteria bacterium]